MKEEAMKTALQVLKKELEKEPLSPERLNALANVITALTKISPLLQL